MVLLTAPWGHRGAVRSIPGPRHPSAFCPPLCPPTRPPAMLPGPLLLPVSSQHLTNPAQTFAQRRPSFLKGTAAMRSPPFISGLFSKDSKLNQTISSLTLNPGILREQRRKNDLPIESTVDIWASHDCAFHGTFARAYILFSDGGLQDVYTL